MLRVGDYEVEALHDGLFALDGGAMFGVVPKTLWEKTFAADARNRIGLALRCLLLRSRERLVLVDTGMGGKWDEKATEMYALDRSHSLLSELESRGIRRDDVTDVVLTHLHFDHAGGTTMRGESGAVELTFPRATHYLQQRNLAWAENPTERDRGSYRRENFELLAGSPKLRLVDGPVEILPGIRALPSDGHTVGLQMIRVESGDRSLVYPADVVPTRAHLKAAWGMSYDLQPLQLIKEKRAVLEEIERDGSVLVFEHDPDLRACTIRSERGEARVDAEVSL